MLSKTIQEPIPKQMKKILVPLDFSKQALYAAKIASDIARMTGAKLFLTHLIELPSSTIDLGGFSSVNTTPTAMLFLKSAQQKFVNFRKSDFLKGLEIETNVLFNRTFEGIIDESKKQGADMIVMGSRGSSGIEQILVGSTTEKVVRHSDVPVLVIKEEMKDFKIEHMVFVSNFKKENKKTFARILSFARIFQARLYLLRVNTVHNFKTSEELNSTIEDFIREFDLSGLQVSTHIYNDVSIEAGVLNFSNSVGADLISLNTHGRRGLAHLFAGSIGEDLANHAKIPVVTFKL